jgi:hypothetical protein
MKTMSSTAGAITTGEQGAFICSSFSTTDASKCLCTKEQSHSSQQRREYSTQSSDQQQQGKHLQDNSFRN